MKHFGPLLQPKHGGTPSPASLFPVQTILCSEHALHADQRLRALEKFFKKFKNLNFRHFLGLRRWSERNARSAPPTRIEFVEEALRENSSAAGGEGLSAEWKVRKPVKTK